MALTSATSLSIASLAIYVALAPLLIYICYRHGKHGFLGWFFLFAFASLQIIASGIQISDSNKEQPSSAGSIISIIGLSPLLLGTQGVLHEVQLKIARQHFHRDLILYILHHFLVVIGVILTAIGASNLFSAAATTPAPTPDDLAHDLSLWRTGASLLFLAWIYTIICAVVTCLGLVNFEDVSKMPSLAARNDPRLKSMVTTLLRAVLGSLPFVGVKTIYGLAYAASQSADLSPATGTIAVRVCLQFLPQLLAVLILGIGGLATLKLSKA